jgi:hypothetical protein
MELPSRTKMEEALIERSMKVLRGDEKFKQFLKKNLELKSEGDIIILYKELILNER